MDFFNNPLTNIFPVYILISPDHWLHLKKYIFALIKSSLSNLQEIEAILIGKGKMHLIPAKFFVNIELFIKSQIISI